MPLCEFSKPLSAFAIFFLGYTVCMVIGIVMRHGNPSQHFAKCKTELADAWRKTHSRSWEAPIFAITFPIILIGVLPMAFPLLAIVSGFGLLFLTSWLPC